MTLDCRYLSVVLIVLSRSGPNFAVMSAKSRSKRLSEYWWSQGVYFLGPLGI